MSLSTATVLQAWIHWEIWSPFVPEFQLTLKLSLKVLTSGLEKPIMNLLLLNPNHGKMGIVFTIVTVWKCLLWQQQSWYL